MPLLNIVASTPLASTFSVAYAFMPAEKTKDYIWALERIRDLVYNNEDLPEVFKADRELALINAVKIVFLNANILI